MNSPSLPNDDADSRLEQAALYYAGALTPDEATQFERLLRTADETFRKYCRELEALSVRLVGSAATVPPSADSRAKLLQRAAMSSQRSDSPELGQHGIFIRRHSDLDWQQHRMPGVQVRYLYIDHERNTQTILMRCAPGVRFPQHQHRAAEESLVLEGDLRIGDVILGPGDYQRCAPGSLHPDQSTQTGCVLLVTAPLN